MIKPGDTIYTFQGEALLDLVVLEILDSLRLSAEDGDAIYTCWKIFCYETREEAFFAMKDAMLALRRQYDF